MDDSDPVNGAPGGACRRQKLQTWKEEAETVSGGRHVEAEPVKELILAILLRTRETGDNLAWQKVEKWKEEAEMRECWFGLYQD